jgi:hypothetical protein
MVYQENLIGHLEHVARFGLIQDLRRTWSSDGRLEYIGVWVRLLRDQPMAERGGLLSAGDKVFLPAALAEGLVRIGDAVKL